MSTLEDEFVAASREVAKSLPMRLGGQAAENGYSSAYQALVKAGKAPQIRSKYRNAKTSKSVR
jgi:hypothetical protein